MDVAGKTRGLDVEAEDMTGLVQPHDKNLMDKELLLMDEQSGFLETKSTIGEDAAKTAEMTAKD